MATLGRSPGAAPLTTSDIPDNSITAAKIVEGTITVGDIGTDAVGTDEIANDAVTGAKIENNPTIAGNLTVSGDLVPSTALSNRNMIINGGMQVWQRATAATAVSSGYSTVDRWAVYENSSGALTSEKYTMSVTELNTTGHATALKLLCTTADTATGAADYMFLRTSIEGQDLQQLQYGSANAKTITLSFWVKSDKTGVYSVALNKNNATRVQIPLEYTISSADTWEKKTITITPTMGSTNLIAVAGGVINNDVNVGLMINFTLMIGDNNEATADTWAASTSAWGTNAQVNWANETNNFYITGVQLELGSNATPFEHKSYGDELARCMRYYQQTAGYGTWGSADYMGLTAMGTNHRDFFTLPIPMRDRPTATINSNTSGTAGNIYCSIDSADLVYDFYASTTHGRLYSNAAHDGHRTGFFYKLEAEL